MTEFDAATLDWQSQYKLLIGSVTPRPAPDSYVDREGRGGQTPATEPHP